MLGDIVEVKPGFGRNYLIPQGKAFLASSLASKELKHRLHHLDNLRRGAVTKAQEAAEALKALSLEIVMKSAQSGRLFGSVTNRDIEKLLQDHGHTIPRRSITLYDNIRSIGEYTFTAKVHTDVKVDLTLKVSPENPVEESAPKPPEVSEETDTSSDSLEG